MHCIALAKSINVPGGRGVAHPGLRIRFMMDRIRNPDPALEKGLDPDSVLTYIIGQQKGTATIFHVFFLLIVHLEPDKKMEKIQT
jgi:hypothetical protein